MDSLEHAVRNGSERAYGRPFARLIAFYLPQFHPIPENDEWWGPGFTEWTNTAKARPRYPGHYQPHIPGCLGYYDLRLAETRAAQAELAQKYGLEGFCYYHYWFAGRRLLERPFEEVLRSGQPDLPFCLCWANGSWTGVWHGAPRRVLIEQTYPGEIDHRAHFDTLMPAFEDRRYIRVDGNLLFVIHQPNVFPDSRRFTDLWRQLAHERGLGGIHFAGVAYNLDWKPAVHGFDSRIPHFLPPLSWYPWKQPFRKILAQARRGLGIPTIYRYAATAEKMLPPGLMDQPSFPSVMPNWDNTPRSGARGLVLHGSTPERFMRHLAAALDLVATLPAERRIVFVKSWNEWAEGNYLEPDIRFGHEYLEAVRTALQGRVDRNSIRQGEGGLSMAVGATSGIDHRRRAT